MSKLEPFGYFRAEPFGWTDCAETDDGAVPLFDHAAIAALEHNYASLQQAFDEMKSLAAQLLVARKEAKRQRDELQASLYGLYELEAERDKMKFALENIRLFSARHRKDDWALLILGFCAEGGVVGSVTR